MTGAAALLAYAACVGVLGARQTPVLLALTPAAVALALGRVPAA